MKIVDLRTSVVWTSHERSWLFVEVHTDDGLVGLGEASQSRNDAGVIEEIKRLVPQYVGKDPLDLIEQRQRLLEWPYVGRTLFAAVSGIEQALWDLCGKHLGVPVYQLLGGRVRSAVRAYANIGYAAAARDTESLATAARGAVADGFDAVKFYPFGMRPVDGMLASEERRWIAEGIENVRVVRETVGNDVDVMVDLMHQFSDVKQLREIAERLDPYDLFWIEDPFTHDHPAQLAELRASIRCRLAGGAPLLSLQDWLPLLQAGALDVLMPDVKWLGGINQVRKVAAVSEAFGVQVSPHNASGPVASAASLHLSLSIASFIILEYPWGVPTWRSALCRNTETLTGGCFLPPGAPGLGVELDTLVAGEHRAPPPGGPGARGITLPRH